MEDMTGKKVESPSTAVGANEWHRFRYRNKTGSEICDMLFNTNLTDGNDPDMRGIKIQSHDPYDVHASDLYLADTVLKRLSFAKCIPQDKVFEILIKFDASFESDEKIEFTPSDSAGKALAMTDPVDPHLAALRTRRDNILALLDSISAANTSPDIYSHIGHSLAYWRWQEKLKEVEDELARLEKKLRRAEQVMDETKRNLQRERDGALPCVPDDIERYSQ